MIFRRNSFLVASILLAIATTVGMELATSSSAQQASPATGLGGGLGRRGLHLDPLPLPASEQPGVTIGWYGDLASAAQRALREGKPLIIFWFNAAPPFRAPAEDFIQQALPCAELNALAGRAVFAKTWSDVGVDPVGVEPPPAWLLSTGPFVISVHLGDGARLRRVRDVAPVAAIAASLATDLSPFLGPVEPTARPALYGNAAPLNCLPKAAAASGTADPARWTPPLTVATPPLLAELKPDILYERFRASVFVLMAQGPAGTTQGSAVAVSPTLLLTNAHVVADATRLAAVPVWAGSPFCPVVLETIDTVGDRAWVRLMATPPAAEAAFCAVARSVPMGIRPATSLRVGERVFAIGTPQGLPWTLTDGLISQLRTLNGVRQVQTNTPITHGSSGGALFDASGNLVGITSWGVTRENAQGLNFAIAAEDFYGR